MNILQVQPNGIAVRLHLITGDDAYPTASRQTELQTGIGLRVIEEQTRDRERYILHFPLLVGYHIAVTKRTIVDADVIQCNSPFACAFIAFVF